MERVKPCFYICNYFTFFSKLSGIFYYLLNSKVNFEIQVIKVRKFSSFSIKVINHPSKKDYFFIFKPIAFFSF